MSEKIETAAGKRRVVICVSFREFDGGPNDTIQRLFLESLERQSYRNFELCVTNFRERNVEAVLKEYSFEHHFVQSDLQTRVSLTNILESGIARLESGRSILVYTNADHVFPPDFLQLLLEEFEPGCSGTFFPQMIFNGAGDYRAERNMFHPKASAAPQSRGLIDPKSEGLPGWLQYDPAYWVTDVTFADGDLMLAERHRSLLAKYRFDQFWPGPTQSVLLTSYSPFHLRKNLFFRTRYAELVNVYGASAEADSQHTYRELRRQEFNSVQGLKSNMLAFSHEAGDEGSGLESPVAPKLQHLRRFSVVGSDAQRQLYDAYLQFWQVRHGLKGRESDASGLMLLAQLKKNLLSLYDSAQAEQFNRLCVANASE